jgi:hypothetical protein
VVAESTLGTAWAGRSTRVRTKSAENCWPNLHLVPLLPSTLTRKSPISRFTSVGASCSVQCPTPESSTLLEIRNALLQVVDVRPCELDYAVICSSDIQCRLQ